MEYDMRGFLTKEKQPELNRREIRYTYDARGHMTKRLFTMGTEATSPFDLRFDHDGAERLNDVVQLSTSNVLKSFRFRPQNGANVPALSAGKLRTAVRYNWVRDPAAIDKPPINIPVTQEYAYSPSHGRIASRVTKANGNTFGVSYVYDSLGDVTKITYPQLTPCSGCASVGLPRTVTNSYNQGQLVGVSGYASSISYYANGVVNTVAHQNNTTDKHTIDTKNYLPRPASSPRPWCRRPPGASPTRMMPPGTSSRWGRSRSATTRSAGWPKRPSPDSRRRATNTTRTATSPTWWPSTAPRTA
jgi:YD repeat-containing protein